MIDPNQLGPGGLPPAPTGGGGAPPPTITIPGAGGGDRDEPAEQAAKRALQNWMAKADNPQEHAFAAKLYQQVTQFIAKEQDDTHNAMGLSGVQKTIARANGR